MICHEVRRGGDLLAEGYVAGKTETSPELRQECHDEINDILEKIKREEPG